MKSLKLAPIPIAILFCLGMHLFMSYHFLFGSTSYRKDFPVCAMFTGIYFVLFLFSFGFFIIEPYKKLNEQIENKEDPNNWFWYIYLSGWLVPCFAFLESWFWDFVPGRTGRYFEDSVLIFFLIKGLFLIPAYLINNALPEQKQVSSIGLFIFIEIILVILASCFFWILGEIADFDL